MEQVVGLTPVLAKILERCEHCLGFCDVIEKCNHNCYLTPSVSAQDPASAPARITKGILPLRMKRGNLLYLVQCGANLMRIDLG